MKIFTYKQDSKHHNTDHINADVNVLPCPLSTAWVSWPQVQVSLFQSQNTCKGESPNKNDLFLFKFKFHNYPVS